MFLKIEELNLLLSVRESMSTLQQKLKRAQQTANQMRVVYFHIPLNTEKNIRIIDVKDPFFVHWIKDNGNLVRHKCENDCKWCATGEKKNIQCPYTIIDLSDMRQKEWVTGQMVSQMILDADSDGYGINDWDFKIKRQQGNKQQFIQYFVTPVKRKIISNSFNSEALNNFFDGEDMITDSLEDFFNEFSQN